MSLKCLVLAAVVITVQCSVIKIQEVPISDDMLMKIVVKEGSSDQSHKIATIKIDLEKRESEEPPKYTTHHSEKPPTNYLLSPEAEEDVILPPKHPRHNPPPVNDLPPRRKVLKDLPPSFDLEKIISESKIFSVQTSTPTTTETDEDKEMKPKIPSLEDRFGIGSERCATGKIRRGAYCVPIGK